MNAFWVIILKSDIVNSTHWEYVVKKARLAEIEQVEQYSPGNRQSSSKSEYAGKYEKDKSLINTDTGAPASGQIWKLTRKGRN
jgi:hypothetical protein